jgi:hypothetical protein
MSFYFIFYTNVNHAYLNGTINTLLAVINQRSVYLMYVYMYVVIYIYIYEHKY